MKKKMRIVLDLKAKYPTTWESIVLERMHTLSL